MDMNFKHFARKLLAATFMTLGSIYAQAQVIWSNPITDGSPNSANPFTTGNVTSANVTVSGIGRGPALSGNTGANRYNTTSWGAAMDPDKYFYFTITPNPGFTVSFSSFVYEGQRSNSGPNTFSFRSSLDGYTSQIDGQGGTGTYTIDLSAAQFQNITTPVTFRLYGWGASSAQGTFSVNQFTFNGTTPLPVTLASFGLKPVSGGVQLSWATATENNTSRFEIQRSEDGKSFNAIGTVAARNNPAGAAYSFADYKVDGAAYYRLRTIDADEQFAYSDILAYHTQDNSVSVALKGNMVREALPVLVSNNDDALTLRIVNMAGITLQQQAVAAGATSLVNMDISHLRPGMYLLQVSGSNHPQVFKFVKQ